MPDRATTGRATRAALEAAAVAAIGEEGWQAAGVRSVTRRAGVPLGAITYHYGGKEQLFRTAALDQVRLMFATPGAIMAEAASVPELVERMLAWSRADDVTDDQRLLLLEVMAQSRRDPELAMLLGQALVGYRAALAEALGRATAVPDGAADAFAAHCDGLWLHAVIEPGFPGASAGAAAAEAWIRALAPAGSAL